MDFIEFKEILRNLLKEIDIVLNEEQETMFFKYMNLLLEWNEKINLTAIIEPQEIILKHFVDSLTISKKIKDGESVVDVGTGAGFPGIPLKILRPNVKVILLDSLNKRIIFLDDVIQKLGLEEIYAIHGRVEEFGKNKKYREKFDVATSRAVANLAVLSEYMLPLVKVGGKCICMKGAQVNEEVANAKNAIKVLGGKIVEKEEFFLPRTDMGRNIVVIEKQSATPLKYPRKPGTPAKEPIL